MRTLVTCLLIFVSGCSAMGLSESESSDPASADPFAPPPGCHLTVCDVKRANCTPPPDRCQACHDRCAGMSSNVAAECLSVCNDICNDPSPFPTCDEALAECRKTRLNTWCVDDLATPGANGEPCGVAADELACACNGGCEDVIEAVAPVCHTCYGTDWLTPCEKAECPSQLTAWRLCATWHQCKSTACLGCEAEMRALDECVVPRMQDPADPSGCYTAAHQCSTKPFCDADGHAVP